MADSDSTDKPEGTAAQLVAAGLQLFGRKGFAATSTREIAAAAGTNVASIAYHFGGKDGLRRACGQEVIRRVRAAIGPALPDAELPPGEAEAVLESVLRTMTGFFLTGETAEDIVPFMLREIAENGPVLDDVYAALFLPLHSRFCALWGMTTGQPADSERTRLLVFSLIGQLLYFRIGRPVVERRMGWPATGADQAGEIARVLVGNLHAILENERRP